MRLKIDNAINVCTRIFLCDFEGFSWVGGGMEGAESGGEHHDISLDSFKENIKNLMIVWDASIGYSFKSYLAQFIEKLAVIEAYTIDAQVTAESHLEALGFTRNGPFSKLKHPGTKLSVWIIPAVDLMKAVGYEGVSEEKRKS